VSSVPAVTGYYWTGFIALAIRRRGEGVRIRAFQFGQKVSIRFDSILATESIFFRFDSIRQSDKFAASTLIFK